MFADGAALDGTIDGKGGTNTLDYSAYTTDVKVNLQTGTATGVKGFQSIQNLIGGSSSNTLTSTDADNAWHITGTNTGSVDGVTFTGYHNLVGGVGNDTFIFADGAGVTGAIDGKDGINALDYSAYTTSITVDLINGTATGTNGVTNIQKVTGGHGDDTLIGGDNVTFGFGENPGHDTIVSGGQGTTFDFSAMANSLVFTIGATDVNVTDGVNNFSYAGTNLNLIGGSANDRFVFVDGAVLNGIIDGKGGSNTLDYSAYTSPLYATLTSVGTISGFAGNERTTLGGFDNISILLGGIAADTLVGANLANIWTISGINAGTLTGGGNSLTFTSFENLIGGSANDKFVMQPNRSIVTIDGGAGTNTLDYSAYTTNVNVNLAIGSATQVNDGRAGGVTRIQNVIGGSADDVLVGDAQDNVLDGRAGNNFVVGAAGNDTLIASGGTNILVGGTGNDTYVFLNGWGIATIREAWNEGIDLVDFSAVIPGLTITIGSVTVTDGQGNVATHNETNIENLMAGQGDDQIAFGNGKGMPGWIDGNAGTNTLDYSAYTSGIVVNLNGPSTGAPAGLSNMQYIIGGSGNDIFNVNTAPYPITIDGNLGDDTLNLGYLPNPVTFNGGPGHNTVNFINPGNLPVVIEPNGIVLNGKLIVRFSGAVNVTNLETPPASVSRTIR